MFSTTVTLDSAFTVGPVRRRLFGSFVEHLGRCVYTGIFEPGHPKADENGFRTDVIDLIRELGVSTVRYPGGNFVSNYQWEDGIGPVEQRPRRLDLAWHSTEPNLFGVDEFMAWTKRAGVEPMMAVNLGTRGVREALDLLEYCNVRGGTAWSDRRRANGSEEPYNVRMWCLGNEMDGPWQTGHKTAYEYARLATETARAMRQVDPNLELVACGSSMSTIDTFGTWERVVLTEAYEYVDYLSTHMYYAEHDGDLGSFLASAVDMDRFISSVVSVADAVRAERKLTKRINLSFDEWNIWYAQNPESEPPSGDDWPVAPHLLEDRYNVADAVVVGDLMMTLLRHADRVHAASLAQLVNVIAPIVAEPGGEAWRQTTFYPFALTASHARGQVLQSMVSSPTYETAKYGDAAMVDATATYDEESGEIVVFIVNRSMSEESNTQVNLHGFDTMGAVSAVTLSNPDPHYVGTASMDAHTLLQNNGSVSPTEHGFAITVPPVSWTMIRVHRNVSEN